MPRPQHTRSQASDRIATRKAQYLRLVRTVVLGTIAVAVAIIWLGDQYGIAREETLQYLLGAAIFVVGLALLGLLGSGGLLVVRRILGRAEPSTQTTEDPEKTDLS